MFEKRNRMKWSVLIGLLISVLVLFVLNILVGSVSISIRDVAQVFFGDASCVDQGTATILLNYRLPQALVALFSGAGLAVAGLLMQTLFRNPLADPSVLGISSGASLGVASVVLLFGSGTLLLQNWWTSLGISFAAFLGALLVLLFIVSLSLRLKNMVSLLLVGIMIAFVASSITDLLKFLSGKEELHSFVIWGMGSFSNVSRSQLPFFMITVSIGLLLSLFLSKSLNIILLGDRYAENLGLNIRQNSLFIILIAGYLTALITAYAGPIAFIGLSVPHIARFLFKTSDHKILIPACIISGMLLALFCNLIARLPGFEGNLPINSVTSLIGAPFVIWIILKRQRIFQQ